MRDTEHRKVFTKHTIIYHRDDIENFTDFNEKNFSDYQKFTFGSIFRTTALKLYGIQTAECEVDTYTMCYEVDILYTLSSDGYKKLEQYFG